MLLTTLISFLKYVRAEEKFSEKLRTQIRRLSLSVPGYHWSIAEACVKALEVDRWLNSDEKEVTNEHRQAVFELLNDWFAPLLPRSESHQYSKPLPICQPLLITTGVQFTKRFKETDDFCNKFLIKKYAEASITGPGKIRS